MQNPGMQKVMKDNLSEYISQKETETPKGKKPKTKRGAKATTRRRGTGNPATDPGPPVNGALKRIDQWPGLEDDSMVCNSKQAAHDPSSTDLLICCERRRLHASRPRCYAL